MKLIDEAALQQARERERCEWCKKSTRSGADPAHIFGRGAGRVDAAWNLASLCRACHSRSHAGGSPTRIELLAITAKRERVTVEWIENEVYRIRRLPKGSVM